MTQANEEAKMTVLSTQRCFSPAAKEAGARYSAHERALARKQGTANSQLNDDLKAFVANDELPHRNRQ